MSERRWVLFASDIIEAIEKIETYTEGYSYEEFMEDMKTKDAVVRNLEIIGEAAVKIPPEIRGKYSEIPWSQIVGLRNRLIHGYFVVDYEIIWEIIKNELPELKITIKKMIDEKASSQN